MEDKPNRLINELSPYLLQHADNPVDWWPWTDEAFQLAKQRDVPVFLSIGYSTCHWCHVMEKESFTDPDVAKLLNDAFVCIKVDREERPDIDATYMMTCQLLTGSGGWPLTIIMTPDKEPFWAGTYLPKKTRVGVTGLTELIPMIQELWKKQRYRATTIATALTESLNRSEVEHPSSKLNKRVLDDAFNQLLEDYDETNGGFGGAPKFPSPHRLIFLLRYWFRTDNENALAMVENTLTQMKTGGINDQLGGGFHRYSTDDKWLLPHFEKMLYDQAMLLLIYTEAYQITHNQQYEHTARDIAEYVLRDLTSPERGFYSAEDADSENIEGKFYLWDIEGLKAILNEADANLAIKVYGLTEKGNFPESPKMNILRIGTTEDQLLQTKELNKEELTQKLWDIRRKLQEIRSKRIRPFRDEKILSDWNGLMIGALAKAGLVFGEEEYIKSAERAASFIKSRLMKNGLKHRYYNNQASINGFLDDYAFLAFGFIELYEATLDAGYLSDATQLVQEALDLFEDKEFGGFFINSNKTDQITRLKEPYDGAMPSGNSVMALNLVKLIKVIYNPDFENALERLLKTYTTRISNNPQAYTFLLTALDYIFGPSFEAVISGDPSQELTWKMIEVLRTYYHPTKMVLYKTPELDELTQFTKNMITQGSQAIAYICQDKACKLPTTSIDEALKQLNIKHIK